MATFYKALGSQYRLELVTTEDTGSINVSNNTSEVDYALYIRKLSGSGYWTYNNNTWAINIDGWTASGAFTYDFRNYSLLLLTSGTRTITHNADGSKTISSSGTFYDQDRQLGSGAASGSINLSTIPRASTSTFESGGTVVTSWDAGDAITIDTNRASSGFTHTLEYAFAGLTGQLIATGVGASTSWTPPLSLLDRIPSALSATLTLTTKTYNGGTYIGAKTTALTLRVPAGSAFEPGFGTITNSETVTAVATNVGAYVQNFSKLALAITSPTEAYSSPIVSFKITIAGQTLTAQSGTTPAAIASSGTVAIVGTVTDDRGRTHSETVNVPVLAHSLPSVAGVQFRRSLSGGTLDENGTYVRADLNVASRSLIVSAVEKNTLKIEMFTRLRGESSWGAAAATINPTSNTYVGDFAFGDYSVGSSYDLLMKLTDVLGAVTDVNGTITTAGVFVHFGGRGEGVGFGKYWGQGSIDAMDPIYHKNGVLVADAGAVSGRNLIINGDFRINQRGVVSGGYIASGGYYLDRWFSAYSSTYLITWADSGGVRTLTLGDGSGHRYADQIVEASTLPAGTYTASWEGTAELYVYALNPVYADSPVTFTSDGTADVRFQFRGNGETLRNVKLERGSIPTPFAASPIGEELALCQRYYIRFDSGSLLTVAAYRSTDFWGGLALPVSMRAKPTLGHSGAGDFAIFANGTSLTPSSVVLTRSSTFYQEVRLNVTGAPAGAGGWVRLYGWLALDAEL